MNDLLTPSSNGSLRGAVPVDATKLLSKAPVPAAEQSIVKLLKNLVIKLKVEGKSNDEIAREVSWTPLQVSQMLSEEWAKTKLIREFLARGKDPALALLQSTAVDNILTMMCLRDDPKVSAAVRFQASRELHERMYGKTRQEDKKSDKDESMPSSLEELDRQLDNIREQQTNTLGRKAAESLQERKDG